MVEHHDVIVALGRRGWGKTTVSKGLQKGASRVVVLDLLHEYSADPHATHFSRNFHEFSQLALSLQHHGNFKIIHQPDMEASEEEINEVFRVVYHLGDVLLVAEEIHHYASVHKLPPYLKQCILTGRHQRIPVLVTTQRPGELHKTILSQATQIWAGSIIEVNDVRYLSGYLGEKAFELKNLKKSIGGAEFLYWRHDAEPTIIQVPFQK